MSKNTALFLLLSFLSTALFGQIKTPAASPTATVSQTVGLTKVTVEYSRPSAKGRTIFGELVPYGKVWRTGANKITTIKFDNDVMVEGQKIKAGSYGLCTIPVEGGSTIILNSDDKQWGTYSYDEKKDVARFIVKSSEVPMTEIMTIALEQSSLTSLNVIISWEKTAVKLKVEQDPDEQIMAEIRDKTSKADCTTDTYFDAADYYYKKDYELKQAMLWADKVIEKDKQYWTYELRARILTKIGAYKAAIDDAALCVKLAQAAGDDSYVQKGEAIIKECSEK